ncbi:MAG TPA: allantoinase AllB, partial [Verrucomicrobiaceae bacterium]
MPDYDLIIRGAHPLPVIGITDGCIAGFKDGSSREEINASGLLIMPGLVDAHVHFNEPGRTDWEGWQSGSRAAVAGGVTTVCDMPLNSSPPVVTVDAFDAKRAAAEAKSICDFAFLGGLVPGHLDDMESLADRGVIGFKAFMCPSGVDDFPMADLDTLRAGMKRAAKLNLPVSVHAEFERGELHRGSTVRDYLASRPVDAECDAIAAALELAGETGCALHVVHVSSSRGVELITEAKNRGVNVTCETCPHYLILTGDDMERIGAAAKCAPPMRDRSNLEAMWGHVGAGRIDTIGSDHSPSPWSMKEHDDFFKVWGGISSIQHSMPLLLDAGLDPEPLARLAAANPARRFRLRGKGRMELGAEADLALVETGAPHEISPAELFYRHQHSPYLHRSLRVWTRRTILHGRTV